MMQIPRMNINQRLRINSVIPIILIFIMFLRIIELICPIIIQILIISIFFYWLYREFIYANYPNSIKPLNYKYYLMELLFLVEK